MPSVSAHGLSLLELALAWTLKQSRASRFLNCVDILVYKMRKAARSLCSSVGLVPGPWVFATPVFHFRDGWVMGLLFLANHTVSLMTLCAFPRAAITNYHKLNSLKQTFTLRVVESRGLQPKCGPGHALNEGS